MCSADISQQDGQQLLGLAEDPIRYGLKNGRSLVINHDNFLPPLQAQHAVIVTLTKEGQLSAVLAI